VALSPADLSALSRLLDDALDLPASDRESWLEAAVPAHLRDYMRALLAEQDQIGSGGPLSTLPALPPAVADGSDAGHAGERVGAYRLLHEIGRGGMGSVWLAERGDGLFERQVALKLPRLTVHSDLAKRMALEQQIAARLEHPSIARLYDAGIDERQRPYLVMEWIPGPHLIDHARRRGLGTDDRVRLFVQVIEAVAHAHRQLVVHRDIKPSNILIDGEGRPKLLDFGIATLLDDIDEARPVSTQGQELMRAHTPRYAAPEQIKGKPVGTTTDIYSLGVVLEELLVDCKPRPDAMLRAVIWRSRRKEPTKRYASAQHMADDLGRWLAHLPIAGAPVALPARLRLWSRRHVPGLAAAAALVALSLLMGGAWLDQHSQARQHAQQSALAQEYLLDVLESSEPGPGQKAGDVTGLQMLDSAAERARRQLHHDPAVLGRVLSIIGHMYDRLGRVADAQPTLEEALKLLQGALRADHPVLAIAATRVAMRLAADRLDAPRVQRLADQALTGCAPRGVDPRLCDKAHAYAHAALQLLALQRGDMKAALERGQAHLTALERGFGAVHAETVMGHVRMATVARNAGDLARAAAAIAQAHGMASKLPEGAELKRADARELDLIRGLVESDSGRYEVAQASFRQLLSGAPSSAQRARVQRLLAQALALPGLASAAIEAAEAAVAAAADAQLPIETAFAQGWRARAASLLARHDEARRDIALSQRLLASLGLPQEGLERQRARRLAAEVDLRAGQVAQALAALRELVAEQQTLAARLPPTERAQALDLLGHALRVSGQPALAAQEHARAAVLWQALPPDHPLRLRHALYAAWASGPAATAAQTMKRFQAALPAGSVWQLESGGTPSLVYPPHLQVL
jgi:tetratricopeptide (TPR) repeat protein